MRIIKNRLKRYLLGGGQYSNRRIKLNDPSLVNIKIGNRVLSTELDMDGSINVISANVNESFGKINKEIIDDYSNQYVLWGIDGDWMVRTTELGEKFYPTDHCGYLKVLDDNINPKYLAKMIEKEGLKLRFSRSNRASIDRVSNLQIYLPTIEKQNEIINQVVELEYKINELENNINKLNQEKTKIVNSILEIEFNKI